MRDFPSCFGENGVQVVDISCTSVVGITKSYQNSATCFYKCKLFGKSCLVRTIWSKNLIGQCLTVEIDDASQQCICKLDVKPSLFSKSKGSKCLQVNSSTIQMFWDLSSAKFGSSPDPFEGYFIAIVCKGEMVLLIGDLKKEAFKKTGAIDSLSNSTFVSKRVHISGKKVYGTKSQFSENGLIHEVKIECDTNSNDPCLVIRIDSKVVMQVEHIRWKFRGNYSISVDGFPVEVYWDVHNWLFGPCLGNAVFMFQTSLSSEKMWSSSSSSSSICDQSEVSRSWRCFESFRELKTPGLAFSLFLYAWKNE